jgi:transcriptional regulator with XRE-family HTH domain
MTSRTPQLERLGAAVRRLRQERGMTQKTLASNANISISGLSRIERGLSNPIVFSTLVQITNALEIPPQELFNAAENDDA